MKYLNQPFSYSALVLAMFVAGCNAERVANISDTEFAAESDQDMVNVASDGASSSSEDSNESGLATNESGLATNESGLATNESGLASNESGSAAGESNLTASVEVDANLSARGLFKRQRPANCPSVTKDEVNASTTKVTFTFANCTTGGILHPARQLTFNGSTTRTIVKESSDTGTVIDRSVDVDRQLTVSGMFGQQLVIDTQNKFTHQGTYPNLTSTVVLNINRQRSQTKKSKVLREYAITGNLSYASTGSSEIEQVVANGEVKLDQKLANRTVDYTFADVTWTASCEHPMSGTITKKITSADGTTAQSTLTFDGTCGSMKAEDGSAVALAEPENDE